MRYRIFHNNESFMVATLQDVANRVQDGDIVVDYVQMDEHDTFYATAYVTPGEGGVLVGIPCATISEAVDVLNGKLDR